ncbi:keratin, type II cytoskeletal cochleal-like [Ascaphus truei]|uniref:keratin, type II cytoskeletal cochleal-like n=1 Tax=Ascaphus truei TaxID=8439 RepID=UPI003F5AD492
MSWNQQLYGVTAGVSGKRFSTSSVGGSNRIKFSSATVYQDQWGGAGTRTAAGGANFGSRSLYSIGGNRKMVSSTSNGRPGVGLNLGGTSAISGAGDFGRRGFGGLGFPLPPAGGIQKVSINQKLLTSLNLDIDPNISLVKKEEREQIKTLNNKFASFIDKVRFLEQQNKVLETKWSLLQKHGSQTTQKNGIESIFKEYVKSLNNQLDSLSNSNDRVDGELQIMQGLFEDIRNKYGKEINMRASAENEFLLLKKDVDSTYVIKVELEVKLNELSDEINFLRTLYEAELAEVKHQITDTSVILSMDNNRSLNLDSIVEEVKALYEDITKRGRAEAEAAYRNKFQQLQDAAGQQGDSMKSSRHEISELNRAIQRLKTEIKNVKKWIAKLQSSVAKAEECGELALKDARAKLLELEAALQKTKQGMAQQLRDFQEMMNVKLALDIEIVTYKKLLEGEEDRISGEVANAVSVYMVSRANSVASCGSGGGYCSGLGSGVSISRGRRVGSEFTALESSISPSKNVRKRAPVRIISTTCESLRTIVN